jgi:hypothetical protein
MPPVNRVSLPCLKGVKKVLSRPPPNPARDLSEQQYSLPSESLSVESTNINIYNIINFYFHARLSWPWSCEVQRFSHLRSCALRSDDTEVGHVGVDDTRVFQLGTDVPRARRRTRVRACVSPRTGLGTTGLLCRCGSRLALPVSGEVPEGPYPTVGDPTERRTLSGDSKADPSDATQTGFIRK